MRKNKPQNLNEQLGRMMRLMEFNISEHSHDVLAENRYKKTTLIEQEVSNEIKLHPYYSFLIEKMGDKSTNYWDGKYGADGRKDGVKMTDEDRMKILNVVQEKVQRSAKINNIPEDKAKKHFENVRIFAGEGKTEVIPAKEPEKHIEYYTGVYPDVDQVNDQLTNFYLKDNEITVGDTQQKGFDTMVKSLLKLIKENNERIVGIKIRAGSSTSQVPTKYKGGNYDTIEEGQKNNVPLVEDRCSEIEKTLQEIIRNNISTEEYGGEIEVENRQMTPNNGPVYTKKERKYFFGEFGKLDPNKKDEYEKMYGPYKGSYGSVTIITESVEESSTKDDPEIKISQEWRVSLTLKGLKRGKKKTVFGNPGGGKSYVGMKAPMDCEFWMKRQ